jgi:CotH kinase protein
VYKEVWPTYDTPEPYLTALETNEDANPSADKMIRFHAAIAQSDDRSFGWLDPKYVFDYIAADRIIINDDGPFHWYCAFNHNYYWYEAETDDRVWLIPWDLDSSFQNPTNGQVHIATPWNAAAECVCTTTGQMPSSCDPLVAQWASRSEEYERAVDAFLAGPFAEANVEAKLAAWTDQIDPIVAEASGLHGAPTYAEWQGALAELHAIIESTREHRGYDYASDPPPTMPDPPPAPTPAE